MRLMRPDQSGHVHAKPALAYMRTHTYIHTQFDSTTGEHEEEDEEVQILGEKTRHQVCVCACVCVRVCVEFDRGRGDMCCGRHCIIEKGTHEN
jgi:hypothetical protein